MPRRKTRPPSTVFSLRVTQTLMDRLDRLAYAHNMTKTQLLKIALRSYCAQHPVQEVCDGLDSASAAE